MSRPAQAQAAEDEQQPADPTQLPPLGEEEPVAAPDPTPQLEAESVTEEAEEDTSGGRRRVAPRNATDLAEEEKELVIDILQQNHMLYSKRLCWLQRHVGSIQTVGGAGHANEPYAERAQDLV